MFSEKIKQEGIFRSMPIIPELLELLFILHFYCFSQIIPNLTQNFYLSIKNNGKLTVTVQINPVLLNILRND